ncbi:Ubiquitin-conjugating enzyme E2 W [Wallemia ichthyophaga EXF-994]|uniref:Ubiquitin-conjugating enzyme E2 W n=1 Tax=Wallemia ichthyophaga (strain EXF-994 / CBS 113033) TaxID=1299270 RepID=R9AA13_WALI9|nr:Ubiquitin-conjugating enzyme E2 W [Wallemia ichthyophaga EXF-994]EOQ98957.1 Ubiquitin-conjugating enzyme E2 W [Wallemia ichthyophaga EXF-994]TIB62012.1 hypothetical protein E3P78_02555 [Wallemia ichthyophaga]
MSFLATKRLSKELKDLNDKGCPTGIQLLQSDDLHKWIFELEAYDSIYSDDKLALMFRFSGQYPIDSPAVQFVVGELEGATYKAPVHPHVYSNGHICASILSDGWSPVLNVSAVCLTIQSSMSHEFTQPSLSSHSVLTSCKSKQLPPDNDRYVARAPENPKKTRWEFHDDTV